MSVTTNSLEVFKIKKNPSSLSQEEPRLQGKDKQRLVVDANNHRMTFLERAPTPVGPLIVSSHQDSTVNPASCLPTRLQEPSVPFTAEGKRRREMK